MKECTLLGESSHVIFIKAYKTIAMESNLALFTFPKLINPSLHNVEKWPNLL